MDKLHLSDHISRQFNEDLEEIRTRVLTMGGLVEHQFADAVRALLEGDGELGKEVVRGDHRVNGMEVAIDEEATRIIARRQPAASDLRLIISIIKTITDLERIGDEVEKVARLAAFLGESGKLTHGHAEIESQAATVRQMLHGALDAFARLDAEAALAVARMDDRVDQAYESIMRQSITFMVEDSRTIRRALDTLWCARALERIGDHAGNICEHVIFLVGGKDVRHTTIEQMAEALAGGGGEEPGGEGEGPD